MKGWEKPEREKCGFITKGDKLMKDEYIPVRKLKEDARQAIRGNIPRLFYASVMPSLIIYVITLIILQLIPAAKEATELVATGSFDSLLSQSEYALEVLEMQANALQLVSIVFYFLFIGGTAMFLGTLRGEKMPCKSLFYYYSSWGSAAIFAIALAVINYAVQALGDWAEKNTVLSSSSELVSVILFCVLVFVSIKFAFVKNILADGCRNPLKAMKMSWKMVGGATMWNIIVLALSFIGWIVLAAFTFGIAFIYVMPYMEMSMTALYERKRRL
jgi:hypothetical protein